MSAIDWSVAAAEWAAAIGPEHVLRDLEDVKPYESNVSAIDRAIPAVVLPGSTSEVQEVVRIANRFHTPLYPISCGRNWGLGSRVPTRDQTAVLDLSRMNTIRGISVDHHYAVVEPGVTQGQLYDHLSGEGLPLAFNVTGSGRATSIIGNNLERGIGYFASRAENMSALEVVLGSGEILRTGFGHIPSSRITSVYRYGIGPSLDGLFYQSNLGIVTAGVVDLIPRPDAHATVIAKITDEAALPPLIDALADLKRRQVIQTVVHVGNRARTEITLGPLLHEQLAQESNGASPNLRAQVDELLDAEGFGAWSAVAGLMGTRKQVRAARSEIRSALKGIARTVFLTAHKFETARRILSVLGHTRMGRRKRTMLLAMEPLYGLTCGIPTDAAMPSVSWPTGEQPSDGSLDPDQGWSGMLHCLPFLPMAGAAAEETLSHTHRIFGKHGFTPYVTLNLVDTKSIEGVINLGFDRRDARRTEAAHQCIDELLETFCRVGYIPYRVGVQSMDRMVDPADPFWQTVSTLKAALDPQGIIAPGRYSLV